MFRIYLIIIAIAAFQLPCSVWSSEGKMATIDSKGSQTANLAVPDKKITPKDTAAKVISPPASVQSKFTQEKNHDMEKASSVFFIPLNALMQYAPLISALAAIFAAFVSLYLGDWRARLRKPKLKLYFSEKKEYPYHHQIPFEWYRQPINFIGQTIYILKPGFNARIKIYNDGKSTAKGVQARVEKISLQNLNGKNNAERFYHPTTIKWSGERNWAPVDIVPESHFFMDLFWVKNETAAEVIEFNNIQYREEIDKEILRDIVRNDICPPEEIYWNVWVDTSFNRGIPVKYDFQGKITIHFIVNGENCGPLKFKAVIDWTFDTWNSPNIQIMQSKNFINND